ncbi:hypothetical protein B0T13DRAFT_476235 [Neurospora crassa]|nr:hypothetical protein B0T13DRAFT_476235 [Neurospora crassa]
MQPQPVFKYLGTYIPNPSLLYPLLPFPPLSSLPSLPSFSLSFVPPSPILLSPSPSLPVNITHIWLYLPTASPHSETIHPSQSLYPDLSLYDPNHPDHHSTQ